MTDLMKKYDYRGWYVGIMHEDTYADREQETEEHGPFSKNMAKALMNTFNRFVKQMETPEVKGLFAVAISGREALSWLIEKAEKQAGWDRNP